MTYGIFECKKCGHQLHIGLENKESIEDFLECLLEECPTCGEDHKTWVFIEISKE